MSGGGGQNCDQTTGETQLAMLLSGHNRRRSMEGAPACAGRQIRLEARSQLKNGSDQDNRGLPTIFSSLAVEKLPHRETLTAATLYARFSG